jgi:hypothetical protein
MQTALHLEARMGVGSAYQETLNEQHLDTAFHGRFAGAVCLSLLILSMRPL